MPNRLASEPSPYLRQHADNPVDWYPFSVEAFTEARASDRPLLLSIGYSACHWCHVMAHESFADPVTAALMNERFVNVKVDREELPDVDQIYQRALQLQGESGGWPLTMFLTPDGVPFFGGTYFPPEDRYGRPSFRRVLLGLSNAWGQQREQVVGQAAQFAEGLQAVAARELGGVATLPDGAALDGAIAALAARVDREHGGFGDAPKFPNASALRLLARGARRARRQARADEHGLDAAFLLTLRKMAEGGLYDQAGGGFARYSTDRGWLVPHFEKMLYDNAQLLALYAEGWQRAPEPIFARAIRGTAAFLERELRAPAGGLYTALDADSDGVEGRYYVWTWDELAAALPAADLPVVERLLGARRDGNWRDPHGHAPPGANVLHLAASADEREAARRDEVLARLFAARAGRVRPGTDDKVLAGVNGLAIGGLAEAGRALGDEDLVAAAARTAGFVLGAMRAPGGRLLRVWSAEHGGRARLPGTLDDHAYLADGLIALYEATGEARWFDEAVALMRLSLELFWDEADATFYLTAADEPDLPRLIERPRSGHDGAVPAGASVLVERLLVVGEAMGDSRFLEVAERALRRRAARAIEQPFAYAHLLGALDTHLEGAAQIVTGDAALLRALAGTFVPGRLIVRPDGAPAALRELVEGKAAGAAYVCRARTCAAPTRDAEALRAAVG